MSMFSVEFSEVILLDMCLLFRLEIFRLYWVLEPNEMHEQVQFL
jgi:hypothetical protein